MVIEKLSLNKGKFLELLELLSDTDEILKAQLRTLPRNATYTSHAIQNEILHILAQKFVPLFAHKSKKLNTLVYQQMRQDM